jgi:hypothetical protein
LRDREAGAAAAACRFNRASHRADALLQHDVAPAAVAQSEQHRGPDGRVAGERQLPRRGENANAGAVRGLGRREHEHRLGVVELARDRLHRRRVERFGVEHDGERIAGKAPVGEHVERGEAPAHESLPCAPDYSSG